MREHVQQFLVAEEDFVNGVSAVLERDVVAIDVRGKKDLWVPGEPLARREIRDQPRWTIRVTNVDNGGFLLGDGGAQKTGSSAICAVTFRRRGRGRAGWRTAVRAARGASGRLGRMAIGRRRHRTSRDVDGRRHCWIK
jgi:hypothetical protein